MSGIEAQTWDRRILPRRGLFDIPLRELWRYRDLIWLLARRNITAQYKQTVLGPLWFIIQPLATTLVFSLVFGRFANIGTDGVPHFLFYMSGLVVFAYFSDVVNKTSVTFTRNAQLFGKVYFPRLAVPLSQTLTSLSTFAIQFGVFFLGLLFYLAKMHWFPDAQHPLHVHPNWRILFFPLFLLQVTMLGLGVGFIVAALTTRYRDLQMGIGFALQLWMYASSVVFSLRDIQGANADLYRNILKWNPMVPVIEGFRFAFVGKGMVSQMDFAISCGISVVVFCVGILMFSRTEQTVMDTV